MIDIKLFFFRHPDIQEQIRNEILATMESNDGKLNYENVGELTYFNAALNENLRLHGPVTMISRNCNKDCEVWIRLLNHIIAGFS